MGLKSRLRARQQHRIHSAKFEAGNFRLKGNAAVEEPATEQVFLPEEQAW